MLSTLFNRLHRIPILPTSSGLPGSRSEHVSGLFAFSTSPEPRASTDVLAADPELVIPNLEINARYYCEMFFVFLAATATPDVKFDFRLPAGGAGNWCGDLVNQLGSTDDNWALALGDVAALGMVGNTQAFVKGCGLFQTGATVGSFSLFWSQNTSDATPTIRQANAVLFAQRYA